MSATNAIPFTVHPREDTGLFNAKVGIWLFLASEVMLFGALFSAYVLLRVGAAPGTWPHGLLDVPVGTLNTVVLITSSITVVMAWASLKLRQFARFKLFQGLTILLAMTFVAVKSFEYRGKFSHYDALLSDGRRVDGHLEEQTPDQVVLKHATIYPAVAGIAGRVQGEQREEVRLAKAQIQFLENWGPWHNTYLAIYFTLTGLHALHVIGGATVIGYLWGPGSGMWRTDPERFTNRVEVAGLFWHFVDLIWIFLFPVLYLL
jgi:cytochrome c oxidase subunit 3